jgi:ketosteroid isomerase-like protein
MAEENVELLRRIYDRWQVGDFHTESLYDERFAIVMGQDFPDHGVHEGRGGLAAYMRGFLDPWERITIEAEELIDGGANQVLARVLQSGTGSSSGIAVDLRYFQLWTFEDEKPVRMETIKDEAEARARLTEGG